MPDPTLAVVIRVNGTRFYCGQSQTGRVQTAWSIAGACLFGEWQEDKLQQAERIIHAKGKTTERLFVRLDADHR